MHICGIDDWFVRFDMNGNCIGIVFCKKFFFLPFERVRKSEGV